MLAGLVRAPSQLAPTRNLGGAKERADTVLCRRWWRPAPSRRTRPTRPAPRPVNLRTAARDAARHQLLRRHRGRRRAAPARRRRRRPDAAHHPRSRAAAAGRGRDRAAAGRRGAAEEGLSGGPGGAGTRTARSSPWSAGATTRPASSTAPPRPSGRPARCSSCSSTSPPCRRAITPQSTVVDRPTQIGDWEPQNANGRFKGAVTLRTCLCPVDQHRGGAARRRGRDPGRDRDGASGSASIRAAGGAEPGPRIGRGDPAGDDRAYAVVATGNEPVEPYAVHSIQGGSQQVAVHPSRPGHAPGEPEARAGR